MKKKIKDLTDKELHKAIYIEDESYKVISYDDREKFPEDENTPAKNITWDNCRFCEKRYHCKNECQKVIAGKFIDYDEIKNSIYADDEVEVDESNND